MRRKGRTNAKTNRRGSNQSVKTIRVLTSDEFDATFSFADDDGRPQPVRINPESKEEREKRLAKRKEHTLKAFQKTYENRRKAS